MAFWNRKPAPETETRDVSRHWLVVGNEVRSLADPENWLKELFGIAASGGISTGSTAALEYSASHACIRLISNMVAECPVHCLRRRSDDSRERQRDHPVEKLLNSFASEWTPSAKFIRNMTKEALLNENAYAMAIRVNGEVREFHQIFNVTVKCDPATGEPVYIWNSQDRGDQKLSFRDVLHLECPLGSATKAAKSIKVGLLIQRTIELLFSNGGMPAGILAFKMPMDSKAAQNANAAWKKQRQEDGPGGISVVGSDATFTPLTFNSVDAETLQLSKNQILDVARHFGCSPTLLALLEDASLNNSEALGRQFLSFTLGPWLTEWRGAIERVLLKPEDRLEYYVEHETAALTSADFKTLAEGLQMLVGGPIMPPNDARSRLNMNKIDGGDRLYPVAGAAPANDNGGADDKA
jgi:HK97 family phage portal protein